VITTASAANHDYLRKLGADEIIDYNAVDFTKGRARLRRRLRTVGGDVAQRSFAVLKPGGRGGPSLPLAPRHPSRIAAIGCAKAHRPARIGRIWSGSWRWWRKAPSVRGDDLLSAQ